MERIIKPKLSEEFHDYCANATIHTIRYFRGKGDRGKTEENVIKIVDAMRTARLCGYEDVAEKYRSRLEDEGHIEYVNGGD